MYVRHALISVNLIGCSAAMYSYDVLCRTMSDLYQVPLVINFDLPPSVEAYVHSVSSAAPSGYGRGGAAVNVITSDEDIVGLRRLVGTACQLGPS